MTGIEIAGISGAIYAVARTLEGGIVWLRSYFEKVEDKRQQDKDAAQVEALFDDIKHELGGIRKDCVDLKVGMARIETNQKNHARRITLLEEKNRV